MGCEESQYDAVLSPHLVPRLAAQGGSPLQHFFPGLSHNILNSFDTGCLVRVKLRLISES
jgi:hypothetical protein